MKETSQTFRLFLVFSILSALYILSMFYRVSNAVMAPNLIQDLGLDAETLGILGGAYFYSFALVQIPMGPMLDRIGPRLVISSFAMMGALGAFLFAASHTFYTAFWGRVLIGLGMASILMSSLKIFTLWFPSKQFATLMGILISVGTLGNILATSPLAYFTSEIGWRMIFGLTGGICLLLAAVAFWVLGRGKEKQEEPIPSVPVASPVGIFQSLRIVLGSLTFWQGSMAAFFRYGTFISLQGLWLGPYLINIKGYSPLKTGNILIFLALGVITGGPISGHLSDRAFLSRRDTVLWGLGAYTLCLLPLIGLWKIESPLGYALLFFAMGFFNTFGIGIYPHLKDLFPTTISGTVMTLINFFTMTGAALLMPAIGKIIESFRRVDQSYPAEAFHLSFWICFVGMVGSLLFYAFSKQKSFDDDRPEDIRGSRGLG